MLTNNLLELKKIVFGLAIGWTAFIAFLCLVTFNDLPSISVKSADKLVHGMFYFVLVMLWGFYSKLKQNELILAKIARIMVIAILYGITMEVLQGTLTTTRHADMMDVVANTSGAILALIVFIVIKKRQPIR